MTRFYTGDQHYYHHQIIEYCNRPYASEKSMRLDMIKKHNEVVSPGDTVYHTGDVGMVGPSQAEKLGRGVISKLNGTHHLILGNHDEIKPFTYVNMGFAEVHTSLEVIDEGTKLYLVHDPAAYCVVQTKLPDHIMLFAHLHTFIRSTANSVNVGVDQWNFYPITLKNILEEVRSHEKKDI